MTSSPEEVLRKQLKEVKAVGQISTMTGEEVVYLGHSDLDMTTHATQLTSAFLKTDQLSRVLKMGSLQKVITSSFDLPQDFVEGDSNVSNSTATYENEPSNGSSSSGNGNGAGRSIPKDHIVQSKVLPEESGQEEFYESDGLITTTAAANLTAAIIGNDAMNRAVKKIL
ncbi:uncharacterized protein SAPINGB_P003594 [Magnusiomyces paraingens]|uniref:Uncharacterized protein n=1 Tax=Magnusiomyces paraingens TaxID=2606893 RepID=A0A5E8BSF3_9ASCO|nr:uncharacterized protein SAPINGB_P003594 [Saprochaete ingens]VVT53479.1 unnamed protein product [Saprochaete ingens]